jgi:hypothetical protein
LIYKSFSIFLIFYISSLLNPGIAFGQEQQCSNIKHFLDQKTSKLLKLIDSVENCSKPAKSYRNKVFSNLRYRISRLKTCIKMVKKGKFGFDCSREFRKTLRSQDVEKCGNELNNMKVVFKYFIVHSLEYKTCLER